MIRRGVRLRGPFAEYELRVWDRRAFGEHDADQAGERVRCWDEDEARALLRSILAHDARRLAPLVAEVEGRLEVHGDDQEVLRRAAWLVARGRIEIIRYPFEPIATEVSSYYEPDYEFVENEIYEGVSLIYRAELEPPPRIRPAVELEPRPALVLGGEVERRPVLRLGGGVEPRPVLATQAEVSELAASPGE